MLELDLEVLNRRWRNRSPQDIVDFSLGLSRNRIVTTSFGTFSAVLLKSMTNFDPSIPVIWCDTGYNTYETYEHAKRIIEDFNLNLHVYVPRFTRAYLDTTLGLPVVGTPEHREFTDIVKLEPFRRALSDWKPEVWFTNIRTKQTRHREAQDIFSLSKEGILKVSPFYYCSDEDLDGFLSAHDLPKNRDYFDPVKALQTRECGIHHI